MTRALVLAIGVCYHAKLQDRRQDFRKLVAQSFEAPCALSGGERQILREISRLVGHLYNYMDERPHQHSSNAFYSKCFLTVNNCSLKLASEMLSFVLFAKQMFSCFNALDLCNTFFFVSCQRAVLNELDLGPNIARNAALGENVFMMVVCIELRIPLFVVGKPGSSKSLAKTVVADNMQGDAAKSELFRTFKQVIV